jgi:hypothetical protein
MNGERSRQDPIPADAHSERDNAVPRSGNGAQTALEAMLRKRKMRAGAEPQLQQPDGRKQRKK